MSRSEQLVRTWTFLTCNWEVRSSNFGRDVNNQTLGIVVFINPFTCIAR
jgi:hypothetical protein